MGKTINIHKLNMSVLEYSFFTILVLNCNSIWNSLERSLITRFLKVALVIVVACYVLISKYVYHDEINKFAEFAAFLIFYYIIYTMFVQVNTTSLLYLLINVFCIYIFVIFAKKNNRNEYLFHEYENLILVIAVISLFFWSMGSILNIIQPTGYVYSLWTGNAKEIPEYFNIYFETQTNNGIIRNTSIFTEAPMYNFTLCIALLFELFCYKKTSISKCVVLIITIISTLTTTGICMVLLSVFVKIYITKGLNATLKYLRVSVIPVLLIIGVTVLSFLLIDKMGTSSGSTRIDDFVAGFKAWQTHPFFGAGYNNSDYVIQFMSPFRMNNTGFSNSPMLILYQGGIFFLMPYLYASYKWVLTCIKGKDISKFVFFAFFIFLFTITISSYKFLTIFIFMAYNVNDYSEAKQGMEIRSYSVVSQDTLGL